MSDDARPPADPPRGPSDSSSGVSPGELSGDETHGGIEREVFGTRAGFVLAAVGSAVGLGNMWRFPYATAEGGGAGFLVLYILLVLLVGVPVLLAEFTLGRRTRLSPIGALRKTGGSGWAPLGYLFVLAGLLILAYYSVIAGWVTRYMLEGMVSGFAGDPATYFEQVSSGIEPVIYHLFFMILTIAIVMGGIKKGIERASLLMMPALILVVAGLALWAYTLAGSGAGYSFYLAPDFADLFRLSTFSEAAAQAFFSLSLGMGALLTFSSYLSKDESLPREGTIIAFSDFGVAFLAGLVVFPVIFALGLEATMVDSAVGALFISIPGAFIEMGPVGRVVGSLFFLALFVGALTSAISLLEVVTASAIDEFGMDRKAAAIGAGTIIAVLGIIPARNIDALGAMDAVASSVFLPLGGLALAVFVGWRLRDPLTEVLRGTSSGVRPWLTGWIWLLRVVAPVVLIVVLSQTIPAAWDAVTALFAGGS